MLWPSQVAKLALEPMGRQAEASDVPIRAYWHPLSLSGERRIDKSA
jgi:hypothetical protein